MERRPRIEISRPVHPQGWDCERCAHVVKDTTPGSKAMKCCRFPPFPHMSVDQRTGQFAFISVAPPVQPGEWCGEYKPAPIPQSAN
jgi:hypothetical protein